MKKRMNKRGQFYLIGAIIIITIIVGFATVSNYARKQSSVKIYDLKDELNIESGKVLEYGTFKGDTRSEDFASNYSVYAGENRNLFFIYGNEDSIEVVRWGELVGTVGIAGQSTSSNIPIIGESKQEITGDEVVISIEGFDYTFELQPGENFFFIISQEVEGETHIVTS